MRLYRQTIEDFGLYSGCQLEEAQLEALKISAGQMSAKMRAVRIVAASSVSKQDLQHRLMQKGENPEHAKQAVAWMEEHRLVDDMQTARQIVQRCIQKGYGLARAKQALYEKRIPKDLWAEVLEDYPDQIETIAEFLRSRLTDANDSKQLRKAVDALLRKGHSYSRIKQALSALAVEIEDEPEDISWQI
jgi:SOS response regulatory protein OraA/RecX